MTDKPQDLHATELVVLVDEDGNEHEHRVVDFFRVAEREYAVLVPLDPDDEGLMLLRMVPGEGNLYSLADIDDEDEYEGVADAWEQKQDAGGTCRVCGCTNAAACMGGCYWVESDLCSQCVGKEEPVT